MISKKLKISVLIISFFTLSLLSQDIKTFTNPIIGGFHPDPSICRVGEDYYLATSSFQFWPGIPVLHSTDLVNWEIISYCITDVEQVDLSKTNASDGLWAPTLRYNNGTYYMIVSNVHRNPWGVQNFYITAKDPKGPWSKPIFVDEGPGIDPDLFFDDDGKVYFSRNDGKGIMVAEIDIQTGKLLSDYHAIWAGTGAPHPEAPHIFKKDGWYYLVLAEGGTGAYHRASIARSKHIFEGYASNIDNPILNHTQRFYHPIQATGHGDFVEAHDGSWWFVFLAKRSNAFESFNSVLGRETFLAPVTWTPQGWPIIGYSGHVEVEMPAPSFMEKQNTNYSFIDNFTNKTLGLDWNYIRTPVIENYSITKNNELKIQGTTESLNSELSPSFLGVRQKHFNCTISTTLEFTPTSNAEEAGLCIYAEETNHYEIALTQIDNNSCLVVKGRIGSLNGIIAKENISSTKVYLQVICDPKYYTFLYSNDGITYNLLGKLETQFIVSPQYTGAYIGLYSSGNGENCKNAAIFEYFKYTTN